VLVVFAVGAIGVGGTVTGTQAHQSVLVLNRPIDPAQELGLPFGARSQYLQPWRGYLDTPPASRLTAGLGINFNVAPSAANATAAALERAGFRRARIEIGWNSLDPLRTDRLTPDAASDWRTILSALFRHHLRPLILFNANEGAPTPLRPLKLHVVAPALAGSRRVVLDSASIAQVVPGRSGFDSLTGGYAAAAVIITAVSGPVATLSAPLPHTLLPGDYPGSTLAYAPFTSPSITLPGAHASFDQTLSGWLSYVRTVATFARALGHGQGFDVEVWNELTFGSNFLNINNYYSPPIDPHAPAVGSDNATNHALLAATTQLIHQRFPGVQLGDGFSSEIPWTSGQTELAGVQVDKHYYSGRKVFPAANTQTGVRPVDWRGRTFGTYSRVNGSDHWTDFFVPRYVVDFPEYWLTGIQTETLVRDLTPLHGENIYGQRHGRFTHPRGAKPPKVWMTEYNLDRPSTLSSAQAQHFQAKVALRYLLAFINKGLGLVDFYAAQGSLGLLPDRFFTSRAARHRSDAGLTLDALGRMTRTLRTATTMRPRSLTLERISTTDHRTVFSVTQRYRSLRNLDVTAFFPFQEATHRFVFAAYVMTRNLTRVWHRSGLHEYDMPAAPYRFTVGNLDGCHTRLSAYDPIAGRSVPVRRVACSSTSLTLLTELTDSPILIQATGG
jgi:hypothetical protein